MMQESDATARNEGKVQQAMEWIEKEIYQLARRQRIKIEEITWHEDEKGSVYSLRIEGTRNRSATQLFDVCDLESSLLVSEIQSRYKDRIYKLLRFFN